MAEQRIIHAIGGDPQWARVDPTEQVVVAEELRDSHMRVLVLKNGDVCWDATVEKPLGSATDYALNWLHARKRLLRAELREVEGLLTSIAKADQG